MQRAATEVQRCVFLHPTCVPQKICGNGKRCRRLDQYALGRYEFIPFANHVPILVHGGVPAGNAAHPLNE